MLSTKKSFVNVGSLDWILSEKTDSRGKEVACLEDFALSARNDFEWLNEYMFETFSRNDFIDVIELLKTPGRLRGKTPRKIQKSKAQCESSRQRIASTPRKSISPSFCQNSSSPFEEYPPILPIDTTTRNQVYEEGSKHDNGTQGALQVSGIWASSDSQMCNSVVSPPLNALADTTKDQTHDLSNIKPSKIDSSSGVHPMEVKRFQAPQIDSSVPGGTKFKPLKNDSVSPLKSYIAPSGSESANWSSIRQSDSDISPYNSPVLDHVSHNERGPSEHRQSQTEPFPSPGLIQKVMVAGTGSLEMPCNEPGPRSDDISDSEISSPQVSIQTSTMVRSSLNFASLPARELTQPRKSTNGARASRSSHLLITAPPRTEQSSGGRVSESSFVAGQQDNMESMQNNIPSPWTAEDAPVPNTRALTPEASLPVAKSKVQRLNERISQLSQLASIRPSRPIPDLEVASSYVEDNLVLNIVVDNQRPNHKSDVEEENIVEDEDEDGDWIPQRPQASQNKVEMSEVLSQGSSALKSEPSIGTPRTAENILPLIAGEQACNTHSHNLSPSRLPKAVTFHTESEHEGIFHITTPKHITQATRNKAVGSYKSPFDSALSAVKNHQANLFTKAKQMLFSKSKNDITMEQTANIAVSLSNSPSRQAEKIALCDQTLTNAEDGISERHRPVEVNRDGQMDMLIGAESSPITKGSPCKKSVFHGSQVPTTTIVQNNKFNHSADIRFMSVNQKQSTATRGGTRLPANEVDTASTAEKDQGIVEEQKQLTRGVSEDQVIVRNVGYPKAISNISAHNREEHEAQLNAQENNLGWNHEISEGDLSDSDLDSDRQQPSKLPKPTPNSATRFQQPFARPSILQKSTNNKNIMRSNSGKAQDGSGNLKDQSANIKLTTASQREMDQRKAPMNSVFMSDQSGQKETLISKIHNSNTGPSTKAPKSIVALTTAARAQKKEQEERGRKRLEIERRRQENIKREEERRQQHQARQKKTLQSALDEEQKKRGRLLDPGKNLNLTTKPMVRVNTVTNLKKAIEQAHNQDSQSQTDLKRQPKRLFQTELAERADPLPQSQNVSAEILPVSSNKRRKTEEVNNESDDQSSPISITAPATTQLTKTKFEVVKSSIFSHLSTPGPKLTQQTVKPKLSYSNKTTTQSQILEKIHAPHSQMPYIDSVKFSHDAIKFAATPATTQNLFTVQSQPSPNYPNGDSIDLPDIQTDSEDEDDQADFKIPIWAESPELRLALKNQLVMDPEAVFGPMAPLSMEDIFKGRGDRVNAKFRNRTSSANWGGQDRLTPAEIEADKIERQRMIENNGWTYE